MVPFLRWAGGKRWLAKELAPLLRDRISNRYFEPFLGSGAMFFALEPRCAVLSDINSELIDTYRAVAEEPGRLVRRLKDLSVDAETYYRLRAWEPKTLNDRALRFIYLNRTCYGGLYRTNRQGRFNVPFGGGERTPEILWRERLIEKASRLLQQPGVELWACDFEAIMEEAAEGDVVYCDPVYTTANFEQFDRYNPRIFSWSEQERLRGAACRAWERGALVIVSNVYAKDIRKLYPDTFRIKLMRKKSIGNAAKPHKTGQEYLIILDPESRPDYWKPLGRIERQLPGRGSLRRKHLSFLPGSSGELRIRAKTR